VPKDKPEYVEVHVTMRGKTATGEIAQLDQIVVSPSDDIFKEKMAQMADVFLAGPQA
jgi:hypothetical protein